MGFYWVSLGQNGFQWVLLGFCWFFFCRGVTWREWALRWHHQRGRSRFGSGEYGPNWSLFPSIQWTGRFLFFFFLLFLLFLFSLLLMAGISFGKGAALLRLRSSHDCIHGVGSDRFDWTTFPFKVFFCFFTHFYLVFFFYRVLLGLHCVLLPNFLPSYELSNCIPKGTVIELDGIRFYWVFFFTEFWSNFTAFHWVIPSYTRLHRVFTGLELCLTYFDLITSRWT